MVRMVPELTVTPWWVIAGVVVAVVIAVVRVSRWTGRVDARLDALASAVADIRKTIGDILERLAPPPAVQASSPIRLTNFGERISATVKARNWANTHALNLTEQATGKLEWEVFELCVSYVEAQMTQDKNLEKAIRAGAYEHGTDIEQVRKVFEVELRDSILALLRG